jgi:hypothetical protein
VLARVPSRLMQVKRFPQRYEIQTETRLGHIKSRTERKWFRPTFRECAFSGLGSKGLPQLFRAHKGTIQEVEAFAHVEARSIGHNNCGDPRVRIEAHHAMESGSSTFFVIEAGSVHASHMPAERHGYWPGTGRQGVRTDI